MPDGVLRVPFRHFRDDRGSFIKPFADEGFRALVGEAFVPLEMFISTSHKDVLRGFHFQLPPADYGKLVFVITGRILDVTLDLRASLPTYGAVESFELTPECGYGVFMPKGFGHAFLSLEANSAVGYLVDANYSPTADAGVLWSSVKFGLAGKEPDSLRTGLSVSNTGRV